MGQDDRNNISRGIFPGSITPPPADARPPAWNVSVLIPPALPETPLPETPEPDDGLSALDRILQRARDLSRDGNPG